MGILDVVRKGKQGSEATQLDDLQTEAAQLQEDIRACESTMKDADATVDALEYALLRKQALEVRQGAVQGKIQNEMQRIAEAQRAALQAQGEELMAAARKAEVNLLTPMITLFSAIGQVHQGLLAADKLLGKAWRGNYPYNGVTVRGLPMHDVRVALARQLAAQFPNRFTWTIEGLVDKEGEAK